MASLSEISPENPSTGNGKRALDEDEGSSDLSNKKPKLQVWEDLDLILSLQSKDTALQRKIELAFDFVTSESFNFNERKHQLISISRLASFLSNWMQPVLISSENKKSSDELFDPCFDARSWAILKFCLEKKPSNSISPNLLRPIARVIRHASVQFGGCSDVLLEQFFECVSLVITSNSRAFYNAGVDLWINCAIEASNLVYKVFSKDGFGFLCGKSYLEFSLSLLEHFSAFLRFYPNPKNVFRVFVDRLLDPYLELLVLLHSRESRENAEEVVRSLKAVEGVLSNGLFHPAHIAGFFNLKNLDQLSSEREVGVKGSYHNHLFHRFRGIEKENKAVILAGFGYLFRLFFDKAKIQKGEKANEASDIESKEMKRPIFEVFMQFVQPLLFECNNFKNARFSGSGETKLVEMHCMLKSINQLMVCSKLERIYVPTEDTVEGLHFNYLKEVHGVIDSISEEIYQFWVSKSQSGSKSLKKILALVSREIFVAYENFMEIEYRTFGDEIVDVWLMMFAFMAINFCSEDTTPRSLLIKEILNFGSQIINVFSELRQMSIPLFALLQAVKVHAESQNSQGLTSAFPIEPLHSTPQDFISSLKSMLCTTSFQLSISNSVRSMPERQAGSFIEDLKADLASTLKWMADSILDFDLKSEILGRVLSGLYTIILDSLTVTSSNSTMIGNKVEKLIREVQPNFSPLIETKPEIENRNRRGNKNETVFICCLLGGNSIPWSVAISWSMVFFFRLYASSRSLYRQSISLMPPDQAKRSSELIGNSIATNFGTGWKDYSTSISFGYFYWISNTSISLLDLIQSLSDALFSEDYVGRSSLIHSLVIMVIQRLNDLNREILVLKFLQKEESNCPERDKKMIKKLKEQICNLEAEAVGLTDFLTRNLSIFQCELNSNGNKLSLGFCSLDGRSILVEVWGFLCRNIDIWGLYASKKGLRKFFCCVLCYCTLDDKEGEEKAASLDGDALCCISSELLNNILLYDKPVLAKNLLSRCCHLLKESLTTVMNSLSADVDLEFLPDWSETNLCVGTCLEQNSNLIFFSMGGKESHGKSGSAIRDELRTCQRVLGILQKMPTVIFNAKISCRFTKYILHLERVVVLNMLSRHSDLYVDKPSDLLRIFLSCRRALRHILTSFDDWCPKSKLFSRISKVFGNESSLEWLLSSLQRVSREKSSQIMKKMLFYLADHTSHIFLRFAEICFSFLLSKGEKLISLSSTNTTNGIDSSKVCLAWRYVETLAQTIESQIRTLNINKVGCIGSCFDIISCLRGFLWGLASTLQQEVNATPLDLKLWCWSRLEGFIGSSENFVDICLYLLLSQGEKLSNDLPDLHFDNDMVSFDAFLRRWVKTKKQNEITDFPFGQFCEGASVHRVSLFKRLFTDEALEMQFIVRELFVASGAIFELRCMMFPPSNNLTIPMGKVSISNAVLHEMAAFPGLPSKFSFTWIEGILQFLQVVAGYINKSDLDFSKEVYSQLISSHLQAMGKCISLEGKRAKLPIHDTGSNTKSLNSTESGQEMNNDLTRFKSMVRVSLKKLIGDGWRSAGTVFVQAVERALVGVEKDHHAVYNVNIGNCDGVCGKVSSSVAAGIDCLYLVLESLSGKERALKKTIPSLVGCLCNIILHLESPNIFCIPKMSFSNSNSNPDAGAVVLMCIEVLTTVVGRHSCLMDACHVSQCLHIPTMLFRNFNHMKKLVEIGFTVDRQQLIDLYAACCKLICAALKHRIREVRLCVPTLEDSTTALLTCLESDNYNVSRKSIQFAWEMQEAIQCASFFRRIYEEIRQQKDVLANNSFYFLATYISIYSGYGPSQAGIKREVDEALRPGVYSLIDICTQSDLQQLHTLLGEGPRRSTLASLLNDYKIHFQYEGKI